MPLQYQLYIDARFCRKHLRVNDSIPFHDDQQEEGGLCIENTNYFGAVGCPYKWDLDEYLVPGLNSIEIKLEPSDIITQAYKNKHHGIFIRRMYAHMVITKGVLSSHFSAPRSYELDDLVSEPPQGVDLIENQLIRRFDDENLPKDFGFSISLKVD